MEENKFARCVEKKIESHCSSLGIVFDSDRRVSLPELNLVAPFDHWGSIVDEINSGQGNELKTDKGKKPKFCSIYSSSCLCVNNFAEFRGLASNISLFGESGFGKVQFEKKLNTGISRPNLDLLLENERTIIGIESKYTELLRPKLPNWNYKPRLGNLSNYLNRKNELDAMPEGFATQVLEYYIEKSKKLNLDVAQLIKHVLGLISFSKETKKTAKLVYIYWEPENAQGLAIFQKHRQEIGEFEEVVSPFIGFHSISYPEFWNEYEKNENLSGTIEKVRKRYSFAI